jgi:protein-tyrosine phosphatase
MNQFIDMHHHILYGLDDGPGTFEEMAAMLRAAAADGIGKIIATPHASPGLKPFDDALVVRRVTEANAYCRSMGLDLVVYPGAEVLNSPVLLNLIAQRRVPTLAGSGHVLIEFPESVLFDEIEDAVRLLIGGGYIPILAHVERYSCLIRNHMLPLKRLKAQYGMLVQMNCRPLVQRKCLAVKRTAKRLLRAVLIDFAATDAHDVNKRTCCMRDSYRAIKAISGAEPALLLTSGNAAKCLLPRMDPDACQELPDADTRK